MSGAHMHQGPPPQSLSALPANQPMGQPAGHMRQNSSQQPITSPTNQPSYAQMTPPPSGQQPETAWPRGPMTMLPATQRPGSGQGQQHERSFSSGSMLNNQSQPPAQQQRNSVGPGLQGSSNSRYNTGPASQQGPPQLGALSFQEPAQQPRQQPLQQSLSSGPVPQQSYLPPNPQSSMGPSQGRGQSPPRIAQNARPVFGLSLQRLYERDGLAVPMVVYQCIQAVDLFGLTVEGIYRLSGSMPHINKLKGMFDTGEFPDSFNRALPGASC